MLKKCVFVQIMFSNLVLRYTIYFDSNYNLWYICRVQREDKIQKQLVVWY